MPEALLASSRRDPLPVLIVALVIALALATIAWPAPPTAPTPSSDEITQTASSPRPAMSHLEGPSHPENLTAEAGPGAGEITLDWDPPHYDGGSPIAYYEVYRDGMWIADTPDTAYLDGGLGDGEEHVYSIAAVNEDGETSEPCDLESATTYDLPGAPRNLTAEAGIGQISLAWDPPADDGGTNVTAYRVYADGSLVATVEGTSYVHEGLGDDETNSYRVSAENLVGEGPRSDAASATTLDRPTAPRDLSATTGPGVGEISIAWDPPADDGGTEVTAYRIYRDDRPVAETTSRSYVDGGLANGTAYSYRVSAVNDVGEGARSDVASATTPSRPSAPRDLSATTGPGVGEISIAWDHPVDDGGTEVTVYRIYRDDQLVAETSSRSTVDTGLANGTSYSYRVSAVNDVGEGPRSEAADAETHSRPSGIWWIHATAGPERGQISVHWAKPRDTGGLPIDGYRVHRDGEAIATVEGQTFVDSGLGDGETHTYRISAVNAVGDGPLSEPVTATTWALPEAPRDVEADAAMPGEDRPTDLFTIELTWKAPLDDGGLALDRYRIYRGQSSDDLSLLTSVDGGITGYLDRELDPTASYVYRVQAVNDLGTSPLSDQTCSGSFPWVEKTESTKASSCAEPIPTSGP